MGKEEKELFESKPIWQTILRLALPTVIGQIILVIYNMADTFFIGLTGSDAKLTAATVCMPAFMFLSAISNLFGIGGASVISRAMGAGDKQRVRHASAFSAWGCLALSVCYALFSYLLSDVFIDWLGGMAEDYVDMTVEIIGDYGDVLKTYSMKTGDTMSITLKEETALQITDGSCTIAIEE